MLTLESWRKKEEEEEGLGKNIAGLRRMRGSLIKQSGARPPHPSLALLQVTEPQIWGLYHCGQNRGEELSKIRYICGLNLLVRDGQWSRSTMINNIRSYP